MQSSEQVNNIAPNYSPEVETEKPFTSESEENDLDGKVLCVSHETAIVESLIDKTAWFENLRMLT